MIETACASTNNFPIMLPESGGVIGVLEGVTLEAGASVARIDGQRYEAPAEMFDELHALAGQMAVIACVAGKVRAGRCPS